MAFQAKITDEQVVEMLRLYEEERLSYKAIGDRFNVTASGVQRRLLKAGVTNRNHKQATTKYSVNHDFFHQIDTEEKAYWLGFLYADGYIGTAAYSPVMGCSLNTTDKDHLEKLKNALDSNHPVNIYTQKKGFGEGFEYARLAIASEELCNDLESHGLFRRKSSILKFPTTVPEHLIHHFIRGYFDGDGSFAKSPRGIGYRFTALGTEEFLTDMAKHIGIVPRLYGTIANKKNGTNNYSLEASAKADMKRIVEYLYNDATVYLDRKFATATMIRPLVE